LGVTLLLKRAGAGRPALLCCKATVVWHAALRSKKKIVGVQISPSCTTENINR